MGGIEDGRRREDLQHRRGIQDGWGVKIQAQAMVRPILAGHPEDKDRVVSVSEEVHRTGH